MQNRLGLPHLGIGLGLRTQHYPDIVGPWPAVDWFEIISENFMETEGRPLWVLDQVAERYPVVMHGVSMSIGSTAPLDFDYLHNLKALRDRVGAKWLSDHLCWTGTAAKNAHDLLPLPYTEECLRHVINRVRTVQDVLEAPLIIENPSSYVEFSGSTMTEYEFLRALVEEADAGLLLDVNNIFVASSNHGYDPDDYLAAIPWPRVVQYHVAGHTDCGTHIIDTHIGPVIDPVWQLLSKAHSQAPASVLLEWDAEIPSFQRTHEEALKAHRFIAVPESRDHTTKRVNA